MTNYRLLTLLRVAFAPYAGAIAKGDEAVWSGIDLELDPDV
jgi:hypothetical protein